MLQSPELRPKRARRKSIEHRATDAIETERSRGQPRARRAGERSAMKGSRGPSAPAAATKPLPAPAIPGARPGRWVELFFLAASAAALVFQLCVPPIVGLADDGDFARIIGPLGIQYPVREYDRMYWNHVTPVYDLVRPFWKSRYTSSETALVAVTRFVAADVLGSDRYDIRLLGGLHIAIFLWALGLVLAALRPLPLAARAALGALLVFVFTDVAYAAPFNSFYSQTAALLAFLASAGMAANALTATGRRRSHFVAGYWLAAATLVLSKPQESVLAPALAILGLLLAAAPASRREKAAGWAAAAALCAAGYLYFASTPPALSGAGRYFALFDELLPASADPARDLRNLGLPETWLRYANTNPYDPASVMHDGAFRKRFDATFGTGKLIAFYALRPLRLGGLLLRGCRDALVMRPRILGNFVEAPGIPPQARSRAFAVWSDAKEKLRSQGVWLVPLLLAGNIAGGLAGFVRGPSPLWRRASLAAALLAAMAVVEFTVVMVAQGRVDLDRHLYLFHAMLDLSFLIALAASGALALGAMARAREARPR